MRRIGWSALLALGACGPVQQPRSAALAPAGSASARAATAAPDAALASSAPAAPAVSSATAPDKPPAERAAAPPTARARAFGGAEVAVFDTAFGGGAPLARGARVGFVQIQCNAEAHRCFNAGYKVNARALFACFRVEHRSADAALLRALGRDINDDWEVGDSALLARLAPATPLPTYAVVRVTGWYEVAVFAKQAECRGPCAHQAPRQVGTRRERVRTEILVQPGGGSPGVSDPRFHYPLAIAQRVPLRVHFFVPEGPDTAPDRLRDLVRSGQGLPTDASAIEPWVDAEKALALRFSGYVMLVSAALSRRTAGAPTGRWLGEIQRLAPILKARLDEKGQRAVDQTLHSLATLQSGGFLTKATACPAAVAIADRNAP